MASEGSPLAGHSASPVELKERLAAQREGLPFLLLRDGDGAQHLFGLTDGDVVADGPAVEVVTHSPTLSPQVARILHPLPYLHVDDVLAGMEAVR